MFDLMKFNDGDNVANALSNLSQEDSLELALTNLADTISEDLAENFREAINTLAHKKEFKNSFNEEAIAVRVKRISLNSNLVTDLNKEQLITLLTCHEDFIEKKFDEFNGFIPPEDYQYSSREEAEANGQDYPYDDI